MSFNRRNRPRPEIPWQARLPSGLPNLVDMVIARHPRVVGDLLSINSSRDVTAPMVRTLLEQHYVERPITMTLRRLERFQCPSRPWIDTFVFHNNRPEEETFAPADMGVLRWLPSAVYFCTQDDRHMMQTTEYDPDLNGFFSTDGGNCYEVWINGIHEGGCDPDSVFCACSPDDTLTVSVYAFSRQTADEYWSEPRTFSGSMIFRELFDMAGPVFLQRALDFFSDGDEELTGGEAEECEPEETISVEIGVELIFNGSTHWRDLCPSAYNG